MNTKPFPTKEFVAPVSRFNWTQENHQRGYKNGGTSAIVFLPAELNTENWGEIQVFGPDEDGHQWWHLLQEQMSLRLYCTKPANRENELFGRAVALSEQPAETQEAIRSLQQAEAKQHSDAEKIQQQLKMQLQQEERKKEDDMVKEALRLRVKALQRYVLKGQWLERKESTFKCIASSVRDARGQRDELGNPGPLEDSACLHAMSDALDLLIDTTNELRTANWKPDKECDGILYYKGLNGRIEKLIDVNDLL